MPNTVLILASGPPAAGKTTISRLLADEFGLPLIAKDAIKERLFDTLGTGDRVWSQQLGRASVALLWDAIEAHLRVGCPALAESAFYAEPDTERLAALRRQYTFTSLQIHCTAPAGLLWERFDRRNRSGDRHPGHVLETAQADFLDALQRGVWRPLRLDGLTLTLDTTDWATLDWTSVRAAVGGALR